MTEDKLKTELKHKRVIGSSVPRWENIRLRKSRTMRTNPVSPLFQMAYRNLRVLKILPSKEEEKRNAFKLPFPVPTTKCTPLYI